MKILNSSKHNAIILGTYKSPQMVWTGQAFVPGKMFLHIEISCPVCFQDDIFMVEEELKGPWYFRCLACQTRLKISLTPGA